MPRLYAYNTASQKQKNLHWNRIWRSFQGDIFFKRFQSSYLQASFATISHALKLCELKNSAFAKELSNMHTVDSRTTSIDRHRHIQTYCKAWLLFGNLFWTICCTASISIHCFYIVMAKPTSITVSERSFVKNCIGERICFHLY